MTTPTRSLVGSILIASDLAEGSEMAAASAAAIAAAFGASVHGLYVEEVEYRGAPNRAAAGHAPRRRSRDPARRLERWLARLCGDVEIASTWEMQGNAARGIVERARAVDADLVVLGRHRKRVADGLLGSTADEVARTSPVPVLLANGPIELPVRSITVPVDLSTSSLRALSFAFSFGAALDGDSGNAATIEIIHVAPTLDGEREPGMERALLKRTVEAEVTELSSAAAAGGEPPRWSVTIDEGLPADRRILEHLARAGTDLVVMGTHGRGGWKRALLGSVASKIGRQASVPVILVPSREEPE